MSDQSRPTEIEPLSNLWLVHRLSRALLPVMLRLGVHPNMVTMTGLLAGCAAAWAYWQWRDPWFATLGFLFMIIWHVMDGLDGQLARATGKSSDFGRLLDGIADYSTFVLVYLALALSHTHAGPALMLAITAGGAHIFQSLFYEAARETYIRRRRGRFAAQPRPEAGGFAERLYNRGEAWLGNRTTRLDHHLQALPAREQQKCLAVWQTKAARIMRRISLLSANGRTFAIWVACMAGNPIYYWLWEVVALSLMALVALRLLRQSETDTLAPEFASGRAGSTHDQQ